ncbi:MAG: GAF domain-containing protein [Planctomycetes bacterium]|nr:GAF domain-containing protein [Planctomycetota bacterium]
MQSVVDELWAQFSDTGVSWVGFYLYVPERDEMVLGPRRDKPACSPIGMHGACGRAFRDDTPLIVRDVKELGESYIACDPKDRSEVVLPIHDAGGTVIGVLDLDSFDVGSFDETDVAGLERVLAAAGLQCA